MAKASGPLMSMSASGKFGGALVFSTHKGIPVVRQLVTPANPRSSGQEASRNYVRVAGVAQKFINATTMLRDSNTLTDKALLTAAAPSGQSWNGFLVKSMIGPGGSNAVAAAAAWTAIGSTPQGAWNTAAAALSPAISAAYQTMAGGSSTTAISAGQVFFMMIYGLYIAGLASVPGATPPTYA